MSVVYISHDREGSTYTIGEMTVTAMQAIASVSTPIQITFPEYEVVNFGFGITLWRDKKTGFVRHPPKRVAS